MIGRKTRVKLSVEVVVTVKDEEAVTRCQTDDWKSNFYKHLTNRSAVMRHFAWNCIHNGYSRANKIDGWADMADDAVTMEAVRT